MGTPTMTLNGPETDCTCCPADPPAAYYSASSASGTASFDRGSSSENATYSTSETSAPLTMVGNPPTMGSSRASSQPRPPARPVIEPPTMAARAPAVLPRRQYMPSTTGMNTPAAYRVYDSSSSSIIASKASAMPSASKPMTTVMILDRRSCCCVSCSASGLMSLRYRSLVTWAVPAISSESAVDMMALMMAAMTIAATETGSGSVSSKIGRAHV